MPFSVSIDSSKLSTKAISLYWRVVSKAPADAAAAAKDDKNAKDDKSKKKGYAYKDFDDGDARRSGGRDQYQPLVHRARRPV